MRYAMYKNRRYRLEYLGSTRYGRRAKLAFDDGSRVFWVDAHRVSEVFSTPPTPPPPDTNRVREDEFNEYRAELEANGIYG